MPFVVLEGGEGSGKSTQLALLAARVRALGLPVVETFEPGGTAFGARVRDLFLHDHQPIDPLAELLLVASDRAQHVAEVIEPALAGGGVVLCDRYSPSTLVYQGVARALGVDLVAQVCVLAERGVVPDLVVVLDVDDTVAAARASAAPDRVEGAGDAFHASVRAAYRDLAPGHGWLVVNGNGAVDTVAAMVWSAVAPIVGMPG